MSKIGRLPITVPKGVEVKIEGNKVTVKGPKGQLVRELHPDMTMALSGTTLTVTRPTNSKMHRSLHGLTRTLINNMIVGVSQGFDRSLELVGVGFRAQIAEGKLSLRVGYSHTVEVAPTTGVAYALESPTLIKLQSTDKELLGETAVKICRTHIPDSYKGKGLRTRGKLFRLKPGKAGKGAAKAKA